MASNITTSIADALTEFVVLHDVEIKEQFFIENDPLFDFCDIISEEAQEGNDIGIPRFEIEEVWQGFQENFTPKGNSEFKAGKVTQRRHKVDLKIQPDKVVGQWEAHLKKMARAARAAGNTMYDERVARREMPLTQYIIEKALQKLRDDRIRKIIYKGEYSAVVTDTPGAAANAVDGFEVQMNNAKAAGDLVPLALGTYSSTTIFEHIESFFSDLPEEQRMLPWRFFMRPDNWLFYQRDKRDENIFLHKMQDLYGVDFAVATQLQPTPAMAGKDRIWATLPGNLAIFIHRVREADNIDIQVFDRYIKVMFDWHECYAIKDPRFLHSNDYEFPGGGSGSGS